ncbi:sensor histidine kinase [Granulicella tundricola]|uniref:histidine kinase n=1 Tax=Granulicella tundricola (strain ATCC BAA-1859 / DSM 23138 / MP5ACTX9) TaxID=1198114 RepID=E8X436_GRATM|nr:sensor histidine kinase [Granulicella tundricola]ADW67096.1 multi-sensor signal transduction histidine kinase [Granulicella tundricola MP5ACTX9]
MGSTNRPDSTAEDRRLEALRQFSILDTLPEQGYEDVTELASFICGTPIALVSLVDAERQWFKSVRGLEARETPVSQSFCAYTVPTGETLIVTDARTDERFKNNPLVLGDPNIRFYAGAPIVEANGYVLGTVCVIDTEPRELSAKQVRALEALARQVMSMMELRKAIAAEAKATETTRLAQESAKIASWEWEVESGRLSWSGDSAWIYGRPAEELAHIDQVLPCVHEEDLHVLQGSMADSLAGGGEFQNEFRVVWPDGSTHLIVGQGSTVLKASGEVARVVGINRDVTQRRLTEEALRQSEKLAAVGRLASTIAHEMNNPLESVTNLLYLAMTSGTLSEEAHTYLSTAERELRRVSAIANQTLRFHKQSSKPQRVSCEDLFESALLIHQGRIVNSGVAVQKRKRATETVLCFDGEIRQVLNNLLGNAIDAMSAGEGRLVIRSRNATDWVSGRKGLMLTVADTGAGMSAATQKRLFDAFFTTKGIGGTGLGLWVSKEIVERHGGALRVRSSQAEGHRGTVFCLFLPFDAVAR